MNFNVRKFVTIGVRSESPKKKIVKMAKLSELLIKHLNKELEQRGLLTIGNKAELLNRLADAMEADRVDVNEYVLQRRTEKRKRRQSFQDLHRV